MAISTTFTLLLSIIIPLLLLRQPCLLWLQARFSGVNIPFLSIATMRFRKVPAESVVKAFIVLSHTGYAVTVEQLEAHVLAGGDIDSVTKAIVSAEKAHILLSFERAVAIDLSERDVYEVVQTSVCPKVIEVEQITGVAKDGVSVSAKVLITIRADVHRILEFAGEETVIEQVKEGILKEIESTVSHKILLENPHKISKKVILEKRDSGTAFDILSIDIIEMIKL